MTVFDAAFYRRAAAKIPDEAFLPLTLPVGPMEVYPVATVNGAQSVRVDFVPGDATVYDVTLTRTTHRADIVVALVTCDRTAARLPFGRIDYAYVADKLRIRNECTALAVTELIARAAQAVARLAPRPEGTT